MLKLMRAGLCVLALVCAAAAQSPSPEQLFRDAVEAQKRGDDALAVRNYQQLLRLHPGAVAVEANLGAALAHMGRYDEAITHYRAALAKAPDNTGLHLNLALAFFKKNDVQHAAAELKPLHDAAPDDPRISTLLGDCYARLGRNQEAIGLLSPLAQAHPDDLDVAWALAQALIHVDQLQPGLALVEKVARQRNSAAAWLLAGDAALRLNYFEVARQYADTAVGLDPHLPGVYTLQGKALQDLGDNPAAIAAFGKALAADPDDFEAHLTLGAILNVERDVPGARKHVERALQLEPSSALARFEMARIERAEGHLDAAVRDMEKVAHERPDWLQLHVELAALYYRVNRPDDGAKEREIVDRLTAAQQEKNVSQAPSP